ncbi:hypothetical protein GCM10009527_095220 [Actinomadura nitritigenes]
MGSQAGGLAFDRDQLLVPERGLDLLAGVAGHTVARAEQHVLHRQRPADVRSLIDRLSEALDPSGRRPVERAYMRLLSAHGVGGAEAAGTAGTAALDLAEKLRAAADAAEVLAAELQAGADIKFTLTTTVELTDEQVQDLATEYGLGDGERVPAADLHEFVRSYIREHGQQSPAARFWTATVR